MKVFSKKSGYAIRLTMMLFMVGTVIVPLARMFFYIDVSDFTKIITSNQFLKALMNSLAVTSVASALSLCIAFILAWCVSRTNILFKNIISIMLVVPMLIPSISHSSGLILLFGTNGLITRAFGLTSNIYGFWGIVSGSIMYSFPVAFLMICDILKYEDYSPYEAAQVLGIPMRWQLKDITFAYLRKPLISVVFTIFTFIFTDYGIPITLGGKYITLPVIMYQEVMGQLNFGKGSVIGIMLLLPAVISFIIDITNKENSNGKYVIVPYKTSRNKRTNAISYIVCGAGILFIILVNVAFVILAFTKKYPVDLTFTLDNVRKTFALNGRQYLINSFIISIAVSAIGTFIAFCIAYLTARTPSLLSKGLHLITITSLAIPGIVLGLSYVLLFNGNAIYGTIVILIIVNIVHFIATPYLMMYNTLCKINENIEAVGQTLGIKRLLIIKDVFIPQTKCTLLEMASYLFVNSMITISAVAFLATTVNKPFSLMINQFDALMIVECSAVVSLILLAVNILCKSVVYFLQITFKKRELKLGVNRETV